jgi:type I restriction enzyme M protein
MDDLDSKAAQNGNAPAFFIHELAPYRWELLNAPGLDSEERFARFTAALDALGDKRKAAHLPAFFQDIFSGTAVKFRDVVTLARFLDQVNSFTCTPGEDLGLSLEYLLQCTATQGENGQFHTPPHIIDFIVNCVQPCANERVLDPACGTGGFLVSVLKYVRAHDVSGKIPELRGFDITDLMVRLSKVNLYLHGISTPDIRAHDTLTDPEFWDEKADLILANPPFMTPKGGVAPHEKFRNNARKSEVLFMEYIAGHLSRNGRAAVIVPNGFVTNIQHTYADFRRQLNEDSLVAVVSLPAGVFKPYSGVKTSVLFLDRSLSRETDKVLFVKVNADGFELGNKRRATPRDNDLPAATKVLRAWFTQPTTGPNTGLSSEITQGPEKSLWTVVPRKVLLSKKYIGLSVERFAEVTPPDLEHPRVRLGDLCKAVSGGTPPRDNPEYWNNGAITWITSRHINKHHKIIGGERITEGGLRNSASRLVPAGTLLLATRVCVGKWTFLNEPIAINQDLTALTVRDERVLPDYMKCVASGLARRINCGAVGTGVRGVPRVFVDNLEIPLPPLDEQRRILAEVDGYQRLTDSARQILGSWVPRLEQSPDWPRVSLAELATFSYGYPATAQEQGEVRYVRISDIDKSGRLKNTGALYIPLDASARRHICQRGDVYIARIGFSAGKSLYFDSDNLSVFASYLIRVAFSGKMLPKFFWYFAQTADYAAQRDRLLTGGGQPHFNAEAIGQVEVPLPSLEEQREIVARLDAESEHIDSVRTLAASYETKITKILDKLWNGKQGDIDVPVDENLDDEVETDVGEESEAVALEQS